MSDTGQSVQSLKSKLPNPITADNVRYNPSFSELREFSRELETTAEFGSASYVSRERSRNSDKTRNAVDEGFDADDYAHIEDAVEFAREHEMLCVDRLMGRHTDHTYRCRLYVPKKYGRIALAWANLFEPVEGEGEPDFVTIQVPDWDEIAIRVLPEEGMTVALGSDYTGEAKKSFLRLFMFHAKRKGGLGLHAGSKRVTLRDETGDLRDVGQVFLGLSATGKSTLTAHGLWLDDPESATMLQDDVCALLPDGSVAGSEGNGLYVKTIGLDADEQPAMYDAVTHESAVLENVDVDDDGTVDFDSDYHTSNGRAIIRRDQLSSSSEDIDLERVDQLFFITRNPTMPPVAKLSPEEAAVAFMLGESIETSAGDPSKAGESIRVVGTNPFIIGSRGEEGNRFRSLIDDLGVETYILNTGHLGGKDIGVTESVTLLREIARGTVEWTDDDASGLTVPSSVPGIDIDEFSVADNVDDHDSELSRLRTERQVHLDTFEDLDEDIRDAVY
ncbi:MULTISPECIES: phosphoenolpyruvate carboxykinase (ATP) [unclassified Haladaptatus]|uniref:phosphoenolpyruvate carboxykinase (ATP) n=1 Tax=unclassified Haladaptatus TaxID=2622732 RepID=UPI00209C28F5|nr:MULTISPECIES: phosphoenolpyruvate carboxykinase (ATP) [unclassified Haladaptatus]MCO8243299.1 phosphoenolpyruvate carboxykinase (ATP) [Haladaptatus sp. AB643]MCO8253010.1 phosphoenolpyruvate carboxykinase (ATP) [Haladaptatus sp. AB618]